MNFVFRFKCIVCLLCYSSLLFSQDWVDLMRNPTVDFREAQRAFDKDWANRDYEKGNGYKQFKRWENFIVPRMDENGRYDPTRAWGRFSRYRNRVETTTRVAGNWTQVGPFTPPSEYSSSGIGRIDCIAFHPTDSTTYWVGAPSGGLWQTNNNGQSWHTISDSWEGLGISDIVIDPDNPNTMYVATGDRDHYAVHAYGVLKSIDGGVTWSPNGLNSLSRIFKLLMDPEDSETLIAATCCGVYRTTNGGLTWALIASVPEHQIFDIAFKPGDSNTVYAAAYEAIFDHTIGQYVRRFGFYRSTNNALTFRELSVPFPMGDINRVEIGVTAAAPDDVYLSCSDAQTSAFYGLYKSTARGDDFVKIASPTDPVVHPENSAVSLTINDVILYQGWYDWTMKVNPLDEDELYIGGAGLIRTYDGGTTWEYVAGYSSGAGSIHVDFHATEYHPITNRVFVGSDGGIWREPYAGYVWTPLNDSLVTTQNYTLSSSAYGDNILVGNQDNNTYYYNGSDWDIITGGDGMGCVIDPGDPEVLYTSSQLGYLYKIDHGEFQAILSPTITNQPSRWETVIRIDPVFRNELYSIFKDVWKSEDAGETWTNISNGKIDSPYVVMEQLEIAESNSDFIYVADRYELFRTTDGGETWNITASPWDMFEGIGDLEIHPTNPDKMWVITWAGRIFQTEDGGTNWTNISGSLPAIKANNIIYQKGSNDGLYLAMDVGVFYRDASMSDWTPFYEELPNVVVTDLEIIYCTGTLRAATYGRGIWETELLNYDPNAVCCNTNLPTLTTTGNLLMCGEPTYLVSVNAAPSGNTYQWYKDGKAIQGATQSSYEATESGVYNARFVNGACSSMASDPLNLTLLPNGICTQTCAEINPNTPNGPNNPTVINITDSLYTPDANQLIWICISTEGDMGTEQELMNIYDEDNNLLGQTLYGRDCTGLSPEACFYISTANFTKWISDGKLTITLDPMNTEIGLFCDVNQACAALRYSTPSTNNCNGDLTVSTVENGSTYQAGEGITSNATIESGTTTEFMAGKTIDLLPGFNAQHGSDFLAYITDTDCSSIAPPEIIHPLANSFVDNGCKDGLEKREWRFEWTEIPGATSYHFLVYSSMDNAPIINNKEVPSTYFTVRDFDFIRDENTTNWKALVRAKIADKWTGWSGILPFNIEALNTDCKEAVARSSSSGASNDFLNKPSLDKELRLMVHPNPATDFVNINCFLNKVIIFEIDLYDVTGKRIQQIRPLKGMDPGEHSIPLTTSHLEDGMYFIVLKNKDFTISKKLVLIR